MHRRRFLTAALGAPFLAAPALARAPFVDLAPPRRHLIMRHALAPGYSDPENFDLEACATQRNLDARGRAQASRTGDMLRAAGLSVDRVLSSQWCRCLETARLLDLGDVEPAPALNSFFEARERRDAQTEATRRLLRGLGPELSCMLVTHQVNIAALLGRSSRSGEVFAFELSPNGEARVLDSLIAPA